MGAWGHAQLCHECEDGHAAQLRKLRQSFEPLGAKVFELIRDGD